MSFTLYKLYEKASTRAISFEFNIVEEDISNRYILLEDEENEITELLRKFDMYDKIRFVDGVAYNISIVPRLFSNEVLDLNELKFDEITETHGYIDDKVYNLEVAILPAHSNVDIEDIIKFVAKDILRKIV